MSSTATTQIITLLGVALGAGAGYISTSLVERSRARRESDARWDARRFDALSDFIVCAVQMGRVAGQVSAARGWSRSGNPVDLNTGLKRLDEAENARTLSYEKVALLGDVRVIDAANNLNNKLWKMEWLARGVEPGSADLWLTARNEYVEALHQFQQVARGHLHVPAAGPLRREVARPEWVDQPPVTDGPSAL